VKVVKVVKRIAIYRKNNGICQKCSKKVEYDDFHADHIKPHMFGKELNGNKSKNPNRFYNLTRQPLGKPIQAKRGDRNHQHIIKRF